MVHLNVDDVVRDGFVAYEMLRDTAKFINSLVDKFTTAGAEPIGPSLRIKISDKVMEFESAFEIKKKFFTRGSLIALDLPTPSRMYAYSLKPPYGRIHDVFEIQGGKVFLKREHFERQTGDIKISMQYPIDDSDSLEGLVYTSAPKDSNIVDNSGEEITDYWLHAQLKTVKLLRDIYSEVTVEDAEVKIEVPVKESVKELFEEDIITSLKMRAMLGSHDRNERARAVYYLTKRTPKFKGNLDKVMSDLQELLRSSRFRRFLALKRGLFRLGQCERGLSMGDPIGPIYLPESMDVFSTTDLTLEEPAKNDNLIYKKGAFKRKVDDVFKNAEEESKKKDRGY